MSRKQLEQRAVAGGPVEAQERVARPEQVARRAAVVLGVRDHAAGGAQIAADAPGGGGLVRDDPAREQVGRGAGAIDPDALARHLVERDERLQQPRGRLAVGALQRIARTAAGDAGAHVSIVELLGRGPRHAQVTALLQGAGRQREAGRRHARGGRAADQQIAAIDVDELAELVVAVPQPHERVSGPPAASARSAGRRRARVRLGMALVERELLHHPDQRVGAAADEVPALGVPVGRRPTRATAAAPRSRPRTRSCRR